MAKMLASNCDALAVTSGALLLLLLRPRPLPLALLHYSVLVASHQHHPEEIVISFGNRATMRTDKRADQRANQRAVPYFNLPRTTPTLTTPHYTLPYLANSMSWHVVLFRSLQSSVHSARAKLRG